MRVDGLDFPLGASFGILVIASISRLYFAKEEKMSEIVKNSESSYPGWEKGKFLNTGKSDYYNEASGLYSPAIPPDLKPKAEWSEYTRAGDAEASLRELNLNAAGTRTALFAALQWGSALFFGLFLIGKFTH